MNKKRMRIGKLESAAFISGFALMVYELAGARILAPYIGSSTYVWTSVIGIIIAALSVGYYVGGKIADARGYEIDIARISLAVALTMAFTVISYPDTLEWVATTFEDARLQGVMASLLLFAPTSLLLGILSPYLVKLNVTSLKTSGQSVASLSALNSLGGIVGTFTAGFVLFSFIGSRETLGLLSAMMLILSWAFVSHIQWRLRLAISVVISAVILAAFEPQKGIAIDTPSAHYVVAEYMNHEKKQIRGLATGPRAAQSGVYVNNSPGLVFWYTRQIDAIIQERAEKASILILGGGALTLTQHLAQKYPQARVDTVEIDPKLADIAREHFNYKDPANAQLIFEDARTYINSTQKSYDIVIADVYGDAHVPFNLTTQEYGDKIASITKPEGIVIANMIAGQSGGCYELLKALDAPYRTHFTYVHAKGQFPELAHTNYIVTYSRTDNPWQGSKKLDLPFTQAYRDNFVPSERLQQACDNER